MPDLPLEPSSTDAGAPVTPLEEDLMQSLKAAMLARLGVADVPKGLHAHHFTRWKLLSMLRARAGDVEKAADRFMECLPAVDAAFEWARRYEAAPAEH